MRKLFPNLILFFLTSCTKPAEVQVVKASRGNVESIVSSVNAGTLEAERSAELAFGAVGRVITVNVNVGDTVKQGQVLAELENADLRSGVVRAQREYDRRLSLGTKQISKTDLEMAKWNVDTAQMSLEKTLIKAPYDGLITEHNLEVGQLSQITTIIPKAPIRIVDFLARYIKTEVDEADLPKIKFGQLARVKILAVRREPFDATVRKIIPYVSTVREQDRTALVELNVKTDVALPAGASADVEIVVDRRENVLAVPSRAVLGRGTERYVYVPNSGSAKKVPVSAGLHNYELTEIKSGLSENDEVIIPSDLSELSDGSAIKIKK